MSTKSASVKIAAFAPIPMVISNNAVMANPGDRLRDRREYEMSRRAISHCTAAEFDTTSTIAASQSPTFESTPLLKRSSCSKSAHISSP